MASWIRLHALIVFLFGWSLSAMAQARDTKYIVGSDINGVTRELAVDRYPALYTGDFGDCLGGQSLFNITKFDAAYYADNLTIVFHLDGTSSIEHENLMMRISVDAYGSNRFDMIFDPCKLNIWSLCPLINSVPVTGWAAIAVGPQQVGGIPPIAFEIPDLEGSMTVQIFANSSESEIGCFQAVMRNGHTFSHPKVIAPVLGVFTLVAIIASFATAAYGVSITHMRMHFAHSLSVLAVVENFQAIFFSGALSLNWPSVCVAWWSNFAWSAGMIHSHDLIQSINSFSSVTGNASQVGNASSAVINTGGGLVFQIYGRSMIEETKETAENILKRNDFNSSDPYDYTWSGSPMKPGMPAPGTWPGFAGTLSPLGIPASDAFLFGLIWLMVGVGCVASAISALKLSLEGLARMKLIKEDCLAVFRRHWIRYLVSALLRTLIMALFMITTLSTFQLASGGSTGMTAIAAVVFALILIGLVFFVARACRARTRHGRFEVKPDQVVLYHEKSSRLIPSIVVAWASTLNDQELEVTTILTIPISRIRHVNDDLNRETIHQDQDYVKAFGWFSARYRLTRWWFLAYYVLYLVVRAAFIGGGVNHPVAQVFGLLGLDILSFGAILTLNPFEGTRNTVFAVWMLGTCKVLTTGLSIAFLPAFNLDRMITTAIGVVIVVVQGLLVVGLMILVVLGAISSWMSLARNREDFAPECLETVRVRYFEKVELKAQEAYRPSSPPKSDKGKGRDEEESPQPSYEPSFSVMSFRREPKIEDEDEDEDSVHELEPTLPAGALDGPAGRALNRASRTNSVSSRYSVSSLPRAARIHRASWSSKDFAQYAAGLERPDSALTQRASSPYGVAGFSVDRASTPVRPQSSCHSLRTPTGTLPSNPFGTPSREILARYAEERRFTSPQPPIPDFEE
ncbi:hypothetical protein B0H63DRAFT_516344 [Podospora didyma]|uniref:ML-like domain-containing protein n=1 Tax=Podospora didyma TaxID=330526 RepID=A0AAE0U6Y1_9PEZI|nr:hypothetical protein B0H63DRAFT_516344 [Podospora didyma]